ncbi:MAG TPA: hypothetical protein VFB59_04865 [Candidatus Saccharimonadales bacterium]|nr:hypothetical protein [Candidatus Saccharimonadales bacterium]
MTGTSQESAEVGRAYTFADLEAVTSGETWANLTPNLPTAGDLLPRDLQAEAIETIVDTLLIDEGIATGMRQQISEMDEIAPNAFDHTEIAGVGTLDKVSFGESKICYALTAGNGLKMAVLLRLYGPYSGIQLPKDPRLSVTRATELRALWEYSDLRAYLHLPLHGGYGISLQELGEQYSRRPKLRQDVIDSAKQRVLTYIQAAPQNFDLTGGGVDIIQSELAPKRHYLRKSGHDTPSVIDIPVVERLW